MKVNRVFLVATAAAMVAVTVPSCMYPPHYSGSSYSSGYGNRSFATTHFVRTNNSRWGYDPYTRCYYDYTRRCYYDPYLNGYYPVGYRPVYVQGTPHPHGWRSGSSYIAPPRYVNNYNLNNYHDRCDRYRSLNTDWSRNIKPAPSSRNYHSNDNHYNHYERNSNHNQSRQSGFGSLFGSSQANQRSYTDNRNQNAYINNTQSNRHNDSRKSEPRKSDPIISDPRMSEPKQESPKSSGKGKEKKEEVRPPTNHESKPKKERGGSNKKQDDNAEAMFRLVDQESNPVKI